MKLAVLEKKDNFQFASESESLSPEKNAFLTDVLTGFSEPNKSLSPKYFYDEKGSHYFDQICDLDEYYPYKAELTLLPKVASELSEYLTDEYAIVEFGAGSLQKIRPLFEKVHGIKRFIPIDISGEYLTSSVSALRKGFPNIMMTEVVADFTQKVTLPNDINETKLGFFPGSTIGNFKPEEAVNFLRNAKHTLGGGSHLLIGVDTKKSPEFLHKAYNDNKGVTKAFNLNVLHRINRELSADINVEDFEHYAFYNAQKGCIEMHLISLVDQVSTISNIEVEFKQGESIHTESSYKYRPEDFIALAKTSGWQAEKQWLAENDMFSMFLLKSV